MYRPDTSEEIQKIYDSKIRQLSDEERFLRGISLTHFCRHICWENLGKKPSLSLVEKKIAFFERIYGQNYSPEEKRNIYKQFNRQSREQEKDR